MSNNSIAIWPTDFRTIREWFPEKKIYPAVFPEEEFAACLNPLEEGPKLVQAIDCDGLLIDTYRKDIGKGLLDYYELDRLGAFVGVLHSIGKEVWLAGSIAKHELPVLWTTGVDVVCVRGAACEMLQGEGRFGEVSRSVVAELVGILAELPERLTHVRVSD